MNTRTLTLTALFIALSAVGGMVKIPLGPASIAMDAMPALVAAFILSPALAAAVGGLGHLLSALSGGFPLGPLHAVIGIEMAVIIFIFALMHQKGAKFLNWPVFIIGNGIIAAIPFYFILSPSFFYAAVPGLLLAATINAGVAALVMPFVLKARMAIQ